MIHGRKEKFDDKHYNIYADLNKNKKMRKKRNCTMRNALQNIPSKYHDLL